MPSNGGSSGSGSEPAGNDAGGRGGGGNDGGGGGGGFAAGMDGPEPSELGGRSYGGDGGGSVEVQSITNLTKAASLADYNVADKQAAAEVSEFDNSFAGFLAGLLGFGKKANNAVPGQVDTTWSVNPVNVGLNLATAGIAGTVAGATGVTSFADVEVVNFNDLPSFDFNGVASYGGSSTGLTGGSGRDLFGDGGLIGGSGGSVGSVGSGGIDGGGGLDLGLVDTWYDDFFNLDQFSPSSSYQASGGYAPATAQGIGGGIVPAAEKGGIDVVLVAGLAVAGLVFYINR